MKNNLKNKNHYIWQYYLKAWTDENNKLIRFNSDYGHYKKVGTGGVGFEKHFYKLKELKQNDIDFVKKLFEESYQNHKKSYDNILDAFMQPFIYKSLNLNNLEIEQTIEEDVSNVEENIHFEVEEKAKKHIKNILEKEDISSLFEKNNRMEFCRFLALQYTRTKKMLENLKKGRFINDLKLCHSHVDIEKLYPIIRHFSAIQLGWNLYTNKTYKIILLKNETTKQFITGDQPVINVDYPPEIPEELELYYPLSPKLAILLTYKDEYNGIEKLSLTEDEIVEYNKQIVSNSHSQVYATSESILKEYCNNIEKIHTD